MPSFPTIQPIGTLEAALEQMSADELRHLVGQVSSEKPRRKAEMVTAIARAMEGPGLQTLWQRLDAIDQAAVAEMVHSSALILDEEVFGAKYGRAPRWVEKTSVHSFRPLLLSVFLPGKQLPESLRPRLKSFVPPPKAAEFSGVAELPEMVPIATGIRWEGPNHESRIVYGAEQPLQVRQMERTVATELPAILRLVQSGKISVGEKTRIPGTATLKAIASVLQGGDFYDLEAEEGLAKYEQRIGPIRPYAWCWLIQVGGLAELAGKKLQLTKAGQRALTNPVEDSIQKLWQKWLKTTLWDEFRRVDDVKGQTGKGERGFTAIAPRRQAIAAGLGELRVGEWIQIDEFFRLIKARSHNFEVHRNPWDLYICESHYGSLGYSGYHDWRILQARYALAFLFEYAATLGVIDVAYVSPQRARWDYKDMWGTDEMTFFSRFDGLKYLRLTPLGAYCLGLSAEYHSSLELSRSRLAITPTLEVQAIGEIMGSDRILLEQFARPTLSGSKGSRHQGGWQLELEALVSAVESGYALGEFKEFLVAAVEGDWPEALEVLFAMVEERTTSLVLVGQSLVIECKTASLAQSLLKQTTLAKLCSLMGDRHLVVPLELEGKFRTAVRKLGYSLANLS